MQFWTHGSGIAIEWHPYTISEPRAPLYGCTGNAEPLNGCYGGHGPSTDVRSVARGQNIKLAGALVMADTTSDSQSQTATVIADH